MTLDAYYEEHSLHVYFPKEILKSCKLMAFQRGTAILTMGQQVDGLYCLVEGRSKTVFITEMGRQLLLSFQDPFKMFGDLEIFDENPEATNTVEAVSDCVCIFIPKEIVLNELAENAMFLKQLAISLGKKLGRVIKNSALNTLNPVDVRLASYILAILGASEGLVFTLNLSATADQLGTSFRHIHRTMEMFRRKKIVQKNINGYEVLDLESLKQIATNAYVFS